MYVCFYEGTHVYKHDDGYTVSRNPGFEEWRVYYRIDNFDQLHEPLRNRLLQLEEERATKGTPRYTIQTQEWYEGIRVGDKLTVLYRPTGDEVIEVVSIPEPENPSN